MPLAEPSPGPGTLVDPAPKPVAYVKNPPGRPRKGEDRTPIPVLPRPASFKGIRVPQFIDYWRKTDAKFPARLVVYVYRSWPVTDRVRCNLAKYIDVLAVGSTINPDDIADADQFETFMFHRFGSGDYKLILNDAAISREVCQVFAKYRDADILPVIDPLASLIVEDPINKPFIEALTRKGVKIPGTYQEIEEEDEMARVTTGLTETVDRLVDKNMEMAQRAVEAATERRGEDYQDQHRQPQSADTLQTSLNIVSTAADMGSKIIQAAMTKASEVQTRTAEGADPVKTIDGFLKLATAMQAGGGNAVSETLMTRLMAREEAASQAAIDAAAAQNQFLRDLILGRTQGPGMGPGMGLGLGMGGISPLLPNMPGADLGVAPVAGPGGGQPGALKGPIEAIRELAAVKNELQDLLGLGGKDEGDDTGTGTGTGKKSFWEQYLPSLLQVGMVLANSIATSIFNLAVARSGQGTPTAPGGVGALNPGPEADNLVPLPPAQSPASIAGTDPALAPYHAFLATLKEPLIQSLNQNESGYDFAEKLVEWQGSLAYDYLREMGPDKLVAVLSTYSPIWEYVSRVPLKFQQFLDEFLSYGAPEPDEPPARAPLAAPNPAPVHAAPARVQQAAPTAPATPASVATTHKRRSAREGIPKVTIS